MSEGQSAGIGSLLYAVQSIVVRSKMGIFAYQLGAQFKSSVLRQVLLNAKGVGHVGNPMRFQPKAAAKCVQISNGSVSTTHILLLHNPRAWSCLITASLPTLYQRRHRTKSTAQSPR